MNLLCWSSYEIRCHDMLEADNINIVLVRISLNAGEAVKQFIFTPNINKKKKRFNASFRLKKSVLTHMRKKPMNAAFGYEIGTKKLASNAAFHKKNFLRRCVLILFKRSVQ